MSLSGVVENLEDTPSSQLRAFCRATSGAAETMSVPTATAAKARDEAPIRIDSTSELIAEPLTRFRIADAMDKLSWYKILKYRIEECYSVAVNWLMIEQILPENWKETTLNLNLGLKKKAILGLRYGLGQNTSASVSGSLGYMLGPNKYWARIET